MMTAEGLAQFFHNTYERLAPSHGYETRKELTKPWAEVPEQNKNLMIAVAREVLCMLYGEEFVGLQEQSAAEFEIYMARIEKERARLLRLCACGHPTSEHIELPSPDGMPLLLCTLSDECGDTHFEGCLYPRCSVPAEVA
jgi:hypothetical protein